MNAANLKFVCDLVYKEAAIVLDEEKSYLIEARMDPLARREGFQTGCEMIDKMRGNGVGSDTLVSKVVDAMTTNETSFFRDLHPFMTLQKLILPEIIERKADTKTLNIWCAAASSGQEPYTIALILRDRFPELKDWEVTFTASDISDEMLARCREGKFSKLEVNRGLPAPLLIKHFVQEGADWQIKEEIRNSIEFRKLNLIADWPFLPRMDIVFIRNVLIYFDPETKKDIMRRIRENMDPGGYMFLGGAETTLGLDNEYHRIRMGKTTAYTLTEKTFPTDG